MPIPCKAAYDEGDLARYDKAVAAILSYIAHSPAAELADTDTTVRIREIIMAVAANAPNADCRTIVRLAIQRLN